MMATPAACIVAVVVVSGGGMGAEGKAARAGAAGDCDGDDDDGKECRIRGWFGDGKGKGNWSRSKFSACLPVGPFGARACVGSWDGVPGWDGVVSEKSLGLGCPDGDDERDGMELPARRSAPQGTAAEVPSSNRPIVPWSFGFRQGGQAPR